MVALQENKERILSLIGEAQLDKLGYIDNCCLRYVVDCLDASTFGVRLPLMRLITFELWLKSRLTDFAM
jgi:hypothetical protein